MGEQCSGRDSGQDSGRDRGTEEQGKDRGLRVVVLVDAKTINARAVGNSSAHQRPISPRRRDLPRTRFSVEGIVARLLAGEHVFV